MNLRTRFAWCAQPESIRDAHGWLTVFFVLNIPPWIYAYFWQRRWFDNWWPLYVVLVSIWALVGTHFTGWVAGRVEVRQEEAA